MTLWTWLRWWVFGRRIVRCGIGGEPYPTPLYRTPNGQPFVRWACGVEYLKDEPGPWPKIDELAPEQAPVWKRLVNLKRTRPA